MRTYRACWYVGTGKTPGLAIPRSRGEFIRLERRLWGVLDPAWVIAAAVRAATGRPLRRVPLRPGDIAGLTGNTEGGSGAADVPDR